MFFLFGWGHQTSKDEGPTLSTHCQNCGNEVWLHLHTAKTWFTIFFIPVIPYELKSGLFCPVCSRGFELQGTEMLVRARQLRALSAALQSGELSEEQYLLQAANLEPAASLPQVAPSTPSTALPAPVDQGHRPQAGTTEPPGDRRPWTWRAWLGVAASGAVLIWLLMSAVSEDRARAALSQRDTAHLTESRQQ